MENKNELTIEKEFNSKTVEQGILDSINNMVATKCIEGYVDYINSIPSTRLEKEFVNRLYNNRRAFAESTMKTYLESLSKEELVGYILNFSIDENYYCYNYKEDDGIEYVYDFFYNIFSSEKMLPLIREHMLKVFNDMLKEQKESAKDREIESLKRNIKGCQNRIEKENNDLSDYQNKLKELIGQ